MSFVRRVSIRKAAFIKALALPVALLTSAGIVAQSSSAAFTASTANPSNSWTAGQVVLTDDDGGATPTTGTAMFTAVKLKPGSTAQKCIVVSSTSTVASTLKLYSSAVTTTNALSTYLDLVIEEGTGGSFSTCTGFTSVATDFTGTLASFGTSATGFGSGVGSLSLTGTPTETRSYRFTYTVNAAAPNTAQNGTAGATFVWEADSV